MGRGARAGFPKCYTVSSHIGGRVVVFSSFFFLFNIAKVRAMIMHNATELVQGLSNVVRVLVHPDGGGENTKQQRGECFVP